MSSWYLVVPIVLIIVGMFLWIELMVEIYKSWRNDAQLPEGDELNKLVDKFPAPQEWHDEWAQEEFDEKR